MMKHSIILDIIRLQHEIIDLMQSSGKNLTLESKIMSLHSQRELLAVCTSKTFTLVPEFLHSVGITHFLTHPYHHSENKNSAVEWIKSLKKPVYHYKQEEVYKILDKVPQSQLEAMKSEYTRALEINYLV